MCGLGLDNTLWDGILVEDGPAKLKLKSISIQAVKELDRRGILNSIASKNNYDDAMRVLKDALILTSIFFFPDFLGAKERRRQSDRGIPEYQHG